MLGHSFAIDHARVVLDRGHHGAAPWSGRDLASIAAPWRAPHSSLIACAAVLYSPQTSLNTKASRIDNITPDLVEHRAADLVMAPALLDGQPARGDRLTTIAATIARTTMKRAPR